MRRNKKAKISSLLLIIVFMIFLLSVFCVLQRAEKMGKDFSPSLEEGGKSEETTIFLN